MSKTNNKFRIIDASTNPNVDSSIWSNCGVESLIIDSERGGIYKGNGTTLPTEIVSNKNVVKITYKELYNLKTNDKLKTGTFYRITDYVATSNKENTTCKISSNFDIVVTSISKNELDEVATTISKDDTNKETYKIWYSLENDSERFAWADTVNGKGVIYRMIDNYNNDIPYDFKNILFKGNNVRIFTNGGLTKQNTLDTESFYNTLSIIPYGKISEPIEGGNNGLFRNVKIEPTFSNDKKQTLNSNIILSFSYDSTAQIIIENITLESGSYDNILVNVNNIHFMKNCYNNYISAFGGHLSNEIIFEHGCNNNFINGAAYDIKMGIGCSYNMFGNICGSIVMEDNVKGNIIGATDTYKGYSTFTNSSFYDVILEENQLTGNIINLMETLGINMMYSTSIKYCNFQHNSRLNIIGNGAQLLTFGSISHHNIIGEYATRIKMSDVCYNNYFFNTGYSENGTVAPSGTLSDITIDSRTCYTRIGSREIIGDTGNIHIGKKCYLVSIPVNSENVNIGSNVWHFNSICTLKDVEIKDNNAEISLTAIEQNNEIKNVIIESGVYENKFSDITTAQYNIITIASNDNTHLLPKNNSISSGVNSKVNGKYAYAFGDSASNGNYTFSLGMGTAYGNGSFSGGGFYSNNYQTLTINDVTYKLSSDGKYTIATCNYTHKGNNGNILKYPCVGNGLNGCIGYISKIVQKAERQNATGVFEFYIPTTSLTNEIPTDENFIITIGTHYVSNATIGTNSFTYGLLNSVKGVAAGAIGLGLQTNNANEFAIGSYNITSNKTLFSIGNGTSDSSRSNIFEIDKNDAYVDNYKVITEKVMPIKYYTQKGECGIVTISKDNNNVASGIDALATGNNTNANGLASLTSGYKTITTNDYEVAFGTLNDSSIGTLFSIGNGISETERQNAFEVKNEQVTSNIFPFQATISHEDGTNSEDFLTMSISIVNSSVIDLDASNKYKVTSIYNDSEPSITNKTYKYVVDEDYNLTGEIVEVGDILICDVDDGNRLKTLNGGYIGEGSGPYHATLTPKTNTYYKIKGYIDNKKILVDETALGRHIIQLDEINLLLSTASIQAPSFYENSDERLKTFGKEIEVDLDKLIKLRKSYFTFNTNPDNQQLGVSAQEIQKLYPEIVYKDDNNLLSVDYGKLSVIALKAIDKLYSKNKEIEERLNAIEKKLKNI